MRGQVPGTTCNGARTNSAINNSQNSGYVRAPEYYAVHWGSRAPGLRHQAPRAVVPALQRQYQDATCWRHKNVRVQYNPNSYFLAGGFQLFNVSRLPIRARASRCSFELQNSNWHYDYTHIFLAKSKSVCFQIFHTNMQALARNIQYCAPRARARARAKYESGFSYDMVVFHLTEFTERF